MAEYLLCVDGGGTKTQAAMCNRVGQVLSVSVGHGCNPQDNKKWADNLIRTIQGALGASGKPEFSVVGMPGYDEVPTIDRDVRTLLKNILGDITLIINDVELACRSAFPEGSGVLLLAGTGSMAMQTTTVGQTRIGGWGNLIGDEGSGFWIGRRALQSLSRAMDGRDAPDAFTRQIATHIGVPIKANGTELLEWLHGLHHPRSQIAALASEIDQMAKAGEPRAIQALKDAATALAHLATTAHGDLTKPMIWAFAGSVFNSRILRKETIRQLGCEPTQPAFDILSGGLWLAAQKAQWKPDAEFAAKLKSTMKTTKDAR